MNAITWPHLITFFRMGIDITYGAFSGAYSAFNRFRQAVARAIGGSYPPHDDRSLEDGRWYWLDGGCTWEKNPGLGLFFTTDDSDVDIPPADAIQIADEMEAILPALDQMGMGVGHIEREGGYGAIARRYIAGCREAAADGEHLRYR